MKNIVLSAAFLLGVSGAAFADQNNKPADYINTAGKSSVSTHAFAVTGISRKIRCDADPRLNRAEECDHETGSRSKQPEAPATVSTSAPQDTQDTAVDE